MDRCSFCGREKKDTNLLIAGISGHICDRCIEQAYSIVQEELGVQAQFIESQAQADYEKNITEFAEQGYDGTSVQEIADAVVFLEPDRKRTSLLQAPNGSAKKLDVALAEALKREVDKLQRQVKSIERSNPARPSCFRSTSAWSQGSGRRHRCRQYRSRW